MRTLAGIVFFAIVAASCGSDAPGSCALMGRTWAKGSLFTPDGCNCCACLPSGELECTNASCRNSDPDAGVPAPIRCLNTEDCDGRACIYEPGCVSSFGYCLTGATCGGLSPQISETPTFCGCDGKSFTGGWPDRPYSRPGGC